MFVGKPKHKDQTHIYTSKCAIKTPSRLPEMRYCVLHPDFPPGLRLSISATLMLGAMPEKNHTYIHTYTHRKKRCNLNWNHDCCYCCCLCCQRCKHNSAQCATQNIANGAGGAVRHPLLRPKNELLPCLCVCVFSFTLLSTAIPGRLKMTDTKGTTG